MSDCDTCGQEGAECHCYLHEIVERVSKLEEELDKLTNIVKFISEYLRKRDEL